MQRIKHNYQFRLIRDAISLLPIKVIPFLETVDFVFDYSPSYIGLHFGDNIGDGRSYHNTCHCNFTFHTSDRSTTIVLFSNFEEYENPFDVIWHEIACAIHERLNFCDYNWIPLWDYEVDNINEVFACSFTRWLYPNNNKDSWGFNQESQRQYDKRPIEFFNKLFNEKRL